MSLAITAGVIAAPLSGQQTVVFERTGYRLTSLGARVSVSARVLDQRRRAVPNAPIAWRISDPDVATVDGRGVVQSRRVGQTKVWAVSGSDSASALILVDQWATQFSFSPAAIRFDAVGAAEPLRVQMRDAAGNAIADRARSTINCRSLNPRVATLGGNGQVTSHGNGVTYIRCTDRGIADSVRIEVRQRAMRVAITDKGVNAAKTVGDRFDLKVRALDPANDTIADARPTWASLNPFLVSVDPLSGAARATGVGTAKIVAQVGDATDTLTIAVAPNPLFPSAPVIAAGDTAGAVTATGTTIATGPSLRLDPLYPMAGDTIVVNVSARDQDGTAVSNPEVTLRSTDTSIVAVLAGSRRNTIVAKKQGTAYLIGQFSGLVDSSQVSVRMRSAATGASGASSTTAVAVRMPTHDTAAARVRNRTQIDSVYNVIERSGVGAPTSGRSIAFQGIASQTVHSTRLSETVQESRTGLVFGGTASVAPFRWLVLSGDYRTGTLTSTDATVGEDMKLTEAGGYATLWYKWIGLRGGYMLRAESTDLALQQWSFGSASVLTRFNFVGDAIRTTTGITVLPGASYTGGIEAPEIGIAGEAGIEWRAGLLSVGLNYYVEKFTFPADINDAIRTDEFSALRLRFGFQAGR